MKRLVEQQLIDWKNSADRQPLLVFGARQIGKSHSVMEFGISQYSNIAVFDFENNNPLKSVFEKDMDTTRILRELEVLSGKTISKGTTLIFFDEIQACPSALTSLKYFAEQAPEYHIVAAGSLLGVAVNRNATKKGTPAEAASVPVGKVDIITMYPMTFEEFLWEVNAPLLEMIKDCFDTFSPLQPAAHEKALELYHTYLYTGGMPRAILEYLQRGDGEFVRFRQNEILTLYSADMAKYTSETEQVKINAVYDSLPYQLAKENKKFQYALVGSSARAASYETAMHWLKTAGLVLECKKTKEGKMPLYNYVDGLSYKIYFSDVGLLNARSNMPKNLILTGVGMGGEAKGAMTENYVAQQLVANGAHIFYWESTGKAEVDFVIQIGDDIVPVEVKSDDNTQSKSLKVFVAKYAPKYAIRLSTKNFGFENNIKSIPLYAVFCVR
jgi:predicted AAA+ superfamily ATPase